LDHRSTLRRSLSCQRQGAGRSSLYRRCFVAATFSEGGKSYTIGMRFTRYYYPFSLTLLRRRMRSTRDGHTQEFCQSPSVSKPGQRRDPGDSDLHEQPAAVWRPNVLSVPDGPPGRCAAGREWRHRPRSRVVRNPGWLTPYYRRCSFRWACWCSLACTWEVRFAQKSMRIFYKVLPWFFLALFGAEIVAVYLPKRDGEYHTREFGRLPS